MNPKLSTIILLASCCLVAASCGAQRRAASTAAADDVVILYENDVHCGVDGYTCFKALKDEMLLSHKYVAAVSSGDFAQGGSLGAVSHGGNIIKIMNEVGYDYVTLGNHEFDYGIPRQQELMGMLNAKTVCCNFKDLRDGKLLYSPYEIMNCGSFDVAIIGMATPYSVTSSTPTYFKDEAGNFIYSFCIDDFYDVAQSTIDDARKNGAEYVVVISHLGDESEGEGGINSPSLIGNTHGIDVVLDGHSHSVIPGTMMKNDRGENVVLTSTGTKFQNMGRLIIDSKGRISTELIRTADYKGHDSDVDRVVAEIKDGYRKVSEMVVCSSDVELSINDANGNRLVRNTETGIGNFCTDAYRYVFDTDIAFLGGGSVRNGLPKGNVTFNDLYTMFPFENGTCSLDITGALLLDVLEFAVSIYPDEFGGFLQVSGLRFEYDSSVTPSVVYDENHGFAGISGERRVKKVEILDRESGKYLPLDPAKVYTAATSTYIAKDYGDGYMMMKGCTNILDKGIVDTDIIQSYLDNFVDKHITDKYAAPEGRIVCVKGY